MAADSHSRENLVAVARREARSAGISDEHIPIFLGLIEQESGFRPGAVGPKTRYGTAKGLTQMIDATAASMGVKDPFDPVQSLRGGARYFKQQLDRYGDVGLALAAYNWGPGNVNKLVNDPRSVRVPSETQNYVPGVLNFARKYGSQLAPSTATLAFFPGSSKVVKSAVDDSVSLRTGGGGVAGVQSALSLGKTPSGSRLGAPNVTAPPSSTPSLAGEGIPLGAEGAQPPQTMASAEPNLATTKGVEQVLQPPGMAPPPSSKVAVRNVQSMDQYLKQQFGPLATAADPFPKGYDQKLMRVIEQA